VWWLKEVSTSRLQISKRRDHFTLVDDANFFNAPYHAVSIENSWLPQEKLCRRVELNVSLPGWLPTENLAARQLSVSTNVASESCMKFHIA
jgi:hypothetical protein